MCRARARADPYNYGYYDYYHYYDRPATEARSKFLIFSAFALYLGSRGGSWERVPIPEEFLIPDHPWAPVDVSADAASNPSHSFAPTFSSSNGSSGDSSSSSSNPSDATSRGQFDDAPEDDDDDDDDTGSYRGVRGHFTVHTYIDDVVITSSNCSSEDVNSVSSTVPYLGNDAVDSSQDSGVDEKRRGVPRRLSRRKPRF